MKKKLLIIIVVSCAFNVFFVGTTGFNYITRRYYTKGANDALRAVAFQVQKGEVIIGNLTLVIKDPNAVYQDR